MSGCSWSTSAVGHRRPSKPGLRTRCVSSYSTRPPPGERQSGGRPDQQLSAILASRELQWFGTGDAGCVAGRQLRVVAQRTVAEGNEYVDVLVGRQIGRGTGCEACTPQHGVALVDADSTLVVLARGDRHQTTFGQRVVDVTLLVA